MAMGKLPNGASTIAQLRIDERHFVAAFFNGSFVTWCLDDELNAYHGHYFQTPERALADLVKRSGLATYYEGAK